MSAIDLTIFEQIKAGGELPSPKGSVFSIIRLTQRDGIGLSELVHAIKSDPVFSGRLIKAANGANRIGGRPIVSILDAVTVLGVPAVRSLALGFSLLSAYREGHCENFDYQHFWSHSLVRAIAMQALTTATHMAPPEDAFSVGLLFRIGELALATLFPDKYSDVLKRVGEEPGARLLELEQAAFVLTHNVLSASMMLDWGMPAFYVEPVYFFEALDDAPFEEGTRQFTLTHLLALSDYVADICLAPDGERGVMMPRLYLLGSRFSLDTGEINAICDKVTREWLEWGDMLKVGISRVPPFEELSRMARPTLADATVGADGGSNGRMRVLIVDDEDSMRAMLREVLGERGHEVFEATNGQQAFEMALELQPQIMVVDWMMPEMDGIKLTRLLRETKTGRAIYILILTGLEDEDRLVEAFENGVDDFMTKPLRPRVLAARLRAGQRVVGLQLEVERDKEEIRRFAAELAVTNRRLQEVARTDALTGFPNRRYAIERIEQEWAAGTRGKRPLAVMVIDVDEFKRFNDTYGHDVGDTVLVRVAAALKNGLRGQDVACRMGGDEFLVICPDTPLAAAVVSAERLCRMVNAAPIMAATQELRVSISIGVAVREVAMTDIDALIKRADQGVYMAKQRNRNCVVAPQLLEGA